jgi:hypothetical protein
MSNLVLFSFGALDLGAAVLALFCGIVLLGGRTVLGLMLRILPNLRGRSLRREPVLVPAERVQEQEVRGVQGPLQRVG